MMHTVIQWKIPYIFGADTTFTHFHSPYYEYYEFLIIFLYMSPRVQGRKLFTL